MKKITKIIIVILIYIFLPANSAQAVMQSLNGQSGQNQSFVNDTNITISSANDTHTFGWSGILSLLRGGTGTSTFSNKGVVFSDGTKLTQNPSNFVWDNITGYLGIGTSTPSAPLSVMGETTTGSLYVANNAFLDNASKFISATIMNSLQFNGSNTTLEFYADQSGSTLSSYLISESINTLSIYKGANNFAGILDVSEINTSNKNFTFPNWSGQFLISSSTSLLQAGNGNIGIGTSSPSKLFSVSSNATTTAYWDSTSTTQGVCIKIKDSDGVGYTYLTVNNGMATFSTTSCE